MFERLWKSKTFWAGLAGLCTVCGGWVSGELNAAQSLAAVFVIVQQIFQRDAIAKAAGK